MSSEAARFALLVVAAAAAVGVFSLKSVRSLAHAPQRPQAFTPILGVGLILLSVVLIRLGGVAAAWAFNIPASTLAAGQATLQQTAIIMAGAYAANLPVLIAYWFLVRTSPVPQPDKRFSAGKSALLAALAFFMAWPLVVLTASVSRTISGAGADPVAHDLLRDIITSPLDIWSAAIAGLAVLATPIVEEVLYRGLLQHSLVQSGMRAWPAIAVTSTVFAFMHIGGTDVHAIPAIFVLSLFIGWAYEKSGRLLTCILAHALFNAANLAMAMLS